MSRIVELQEEKKALKLELLEFSLKDEIRTLKAKLKIRKYDSQIPVDKKFDSVSKWLIKNYGRSFCLKEICEELNLKGPIVKSYLKKLSVSQHGKNGRYIKKDGSSGNGNYYTVIYEQVSW